MPNPNKVTHLFEHQPEKRAGMGFIKLHRELLQHDIRKENDSVHAWIHFLLTAAYKPKEFKLPDGTAVALAAGQLITGRKSLAETVNVNERRAQTIISKFERLGMITLSPVAKKFTRVTINNWLNYQLNDSETESIPRTRNGQGKDKANAQPIRAYNEQRTSNGQETVIIEEVKNITNNTKVLLESDSKESNTRKKSPNTPYQNIWDLYQDILVNNNVKSLIDVQVLSKKRKTRLKGLWHNVNFDLAKIEKYFKYLFDKRDNHSWLFGNNDRGWVADIEYVCREETLIKARENRLGNFGGNQ
jgi:hypothetical protein